MRFRIAIGATLALAGCASFEKLPADYNFGPPPQVTEAALQQYFQGILKDPDSARYQIGEMYTGSCNNGSLYGGKISWAGWAVNVGVNARNSFGGYTGAQPYTVLMTGNTVSRHIEGHDFGAYSGVVCRKA